jgi:hypothetical protein
MPGGVGVPFLKNTADGKTLRACNFFVGNPEEKNHLRDLRADGRTILKLMSEKYGVCGLDATCHCSLVPANVVLSVT